MKLIQIFSKTPSHKRFSYAPRFYDPQEEERLERENRIRRELAAQKSADETTRENAATEEDNTYVAGYRNRISGSFKMSKKTATVQADPSSSMLRLVILLILTVGLIAYLQFGSIALYVVGFVFFPFYFYLKFRNSPKKTK